MADKITLTERLAKITKAFPPNSLCCQSTPLADIRKNSKAAKAELARVLSKEPQNG